MTLNLPAPIAAYVIAENGNDPKAMEQCFAIDATVHDEGQTFKGLAAIQRWKAQTKEKYQHTVEPIAYVPSQGGGIVTMRLTGKFPGSPIEVKFAFVVGGDKITSLDIHS
jgi:hypothetical protein